MKVYALALVWTVALCLGGLVASAQQDPVFENVNHNDWFNLSQGSLFKFFIIVTDPDGSYPINFSYSEQGDLFPSFSLFNYNATASIMNFTPTNEDVGDPESGPVNYSIFVIAEDNGGDNGDLETIKLWFTVENVNDPPNITWWAPPNVTVETVENISVGFWFNYSTTDVDIPWGDELNASWFIDDTVQYSTKDLNGSWTYFPDFCSAGWHNVTLQVSDLNGSLDSHNWTLSVNNSNREPYFNNTILNMTWPEDTTLEDNLSMFDYFVDLDVLGCTGSNKDNVNFTVVGATNIQFQFDYDDYNATIIPASDWFGVEYVQIVLDDTYNTTISNVIRLNVTNVNDPPVLGFIDNQTLAINVRHEYHVNATDVDYDTLYYWTNSSVITVDPLTGWMNFTPQASDIGVHYVNVSVNDTVYSDSQIVRYTVLDNVPPYITPISDQAASEGSLFTTTVNATDSDGDNLTFTSNTTLFNITTSDNGTGFAVGTISFTPDNSDVGIHYIIIRVYDEKSAWNETEVMFNVTDYNNQPTFPAITEIRLKLNFSYVLNITATDGDSDDVLTFSDNASFFNIDPANAVTPAVSTTIINVTNTSLLGEHYVNISVTDDDPVPKMYSELVRFVIQVNQPPSIYPLDPTEVAEDTALEIIVNGYDPNEDQLYYDTNTSMFNITLFNATAGLINFTPGFADVGNYSILINVTDGYGGNNFTIFFLNITPSNDEPYWLNLLDNYTMYEDLPAELFLITSDEEDDSMSAWINHSLFNLTQINNTMFLLNLTPLPQDVGFYQINVSLADPYNLVTQIVNFTIVMVNDPPVIQAYVPNQSAVTVLENTSLFFNVTSVYDEENDTVSFRYELNGVNMSFDRSWTYLPGFCDAGFYVVTVVAEDDRNASSSHSWNMTVNNSNRGPFLNTTLPSLTWVEDNDLIDNFTLTDYFYDPDYHECNNSANRDNLTYGVAGDAYVSVNIGPDGWISLYPSTDWYGIEVIYFTVNDTHDFLSSNNMTLNVTGVNDAPVLASISDQLSGIGVILNFTVTAADPDDTVLTFSDNASMFNLTYLTGTSALINFTVLSTMVGNHTVNISVTDGQESDSQLVIFMLNGTNAAPNITMVYPYGWPLSNCTVFNFSSIANFPLGTRINLSENSTILFNHTSTDLDGDPISYRWLLNGVEQATTPHWYYEVGWFDQGYRNVTLVVSDPHTNADTFYWNLSVANVNRLPYFGYKVFSTLAEFMNGTDNRTNSTREPGNVTLAYSASPNFHTNGTYLSAVIDFQTDTRSTDARPNVTVINWTAVMLAATNLTFQTRISSDQITWHNWSTPYEQPGVVNFDAGFMQNASPATWDTRFLQYQANFTTTMATSSPVLESVRIEYEIADFKAVSGRSVNDLVDLDDYFIDPDNESLNYTVVNVQNADRLGMSIDSDGYLDISPGGDFSGNAEFYIRATDNHSNHTVVSNNVTILVLEGAQSLVPIPSSGASSVKTITITRTLVQNITKPVSMELVVPQPLIISNALEILAPLELVNNGNVTLTNITLQAGTQEPNVTLTFEKSYFRQLKKDEKTKTTLFIRTDFRKNSPYQVNITAISADPYYTDSVLISINPLEIPNEVNESVRFVRDLLANNPECLELNELMLQAEKAIGDAQFEYAQELLSGAVDACRYLISAGRKNIEQPEQLTTAGVMKRFIRENLVPLSIVGFFTALLMAYAVFVIVRNRNRQLKIG
jgi:hypothetical protein